MADFTHGRSMTFTRAIFVDCRLLVGSCSSQLTVNRAMSRHRTLIGDCLAAPPVGVGLPVGVEVGGVQRLQFGHPFVLAVV